MLIYYIFTDHRTGQNFIIPEMADSSLDLSELAKAAKKKLQAVSISAYYYDKTLHLFDLIWAPRITSLCLLFKEWCCWVIWDDRGDPHLKTTSLVDFLTM